jgi:tRNA-Thr(GGU) m(6)t(6)A37 methyltransferase TsaA
MSDPAATQSIIVERVMPHPPEKVWRALTQGALIEEWLMKNDFQPVVGHRFSFRTAPMPHWNGVVDCEVLLVEPNRRLSYRWNTAGDQAGSGLRTIVTWTLTPATGGTHVRMEQSGFRAEEEANYRGAQYGWQRFLDGLERVVAALASDEATSFEVKPIGRVASSLTDLETAPRQADEDAPEAWLVFEPEMLEGLRNLRAGDEIIVLTWLDRARRDVLSVHPRGDPARPLEGVFSTRSPHRPNPIGLHRVEIVGIDGRRVQVGALEALNGTPIIDIKPVLSGSIVER